MVYATFPRISPDDQQQTLKHVRYGAHFEAETNIVRCRLRVRLGPLKMSTSYSLSLRSLPICGSRERTKRAINDRIVKGLASRRRAGGEALPPHGGGVDGIIPKRGQILVK
jgi:hypothetical protein